MRKYTSPALIIFFMAILGTSFSCGNQHEHHHHAHVLKLTQEQKEQKLKHTEFTISGMTCTGCSNKIKNELLKINGIVEVHIDHKKEEHNAEIIYDPKKTNPKSMKKAIKKLNYTIKH